MSYRIPPDEPVDAAVHRIARELCATATGAVARERDLDQAVHEARKACKKLRALLALVRSGIPDETRRDQRRKIAAASRLFSEARNAVVVSQCFERLWRLGSFEVGGDSTASHLAADRQRAKQTLVAKDAIAEFQERLVAARDTLAELPVTDDAAILRDGIRRSYRRARDAEPEVDEPERLHAWRKAVKEHGYHVRLLSDRAPLAARSASLDALSEFLGDDRDLTLLAVRLAEPGPIPALQAVLRRASHAVARELFRDPPRKFVKRLGL